MTLRFRHSRRVDGSLSADPARSSDINYMITHIFRRGAATRPVPVRNHLVFFVTITFLLLSWLAFGACGLRTLPPVKYLPLVGAEKKITTTEMMALALKDRDVALRAQAVELLGGLSQSDRDNVKKEVARVFGETLKDRDPGIRLQVIEKLGKMEKKYSNKYLVSAIWDPNPFVREKVLSTITNREEDRLAKEAARLSEEHDPPGPPSQSAERRGIGLAKNPLAP